MQATRVTATDFGWTDTEGWYQVDLNGFTLDFYFRPSATRRAYVFSPGWMNRETNKHPYFQRIKWFAHVDGIGVSLADPTLDLSEDVQIGWFVGTKSVDYAKVTIAYLAELFSRLGIVPEKTLFFGSSAGGFASLAFAAHMPGSRALAANPQTDVTQFHEPVELGKMMRATFGGLNLTLMPERFWARLRIADLWRINGVVPRAIIVLNTYDSWHLQQHVVPLLRSIDGLQVDGRLDVRFYSDTEKGHNPPGLDLLLPMMSELLT